MKEFIERFQRAFQAYQREDFAAALEALEAAEEKYNFEDATEGGVGLEDLNILKGTCLLMLDRFEDARTSFEKALKINPYSAEACLGLGKLFYYDGLLEQSKTMFEWAVKNDPNNPAAAQNLAEINRKLEKPASHSALDEMEDVEESRAYREPIDEAYELFEKRDYRSALEYLEVAESDFMERLASVSNFKGFNYLGLQEVELAEKAFKRAEGLNPKSSQANAGLGEVAYIKGDDAEAKRRFVEALKINPQNEFAKAGMQKIGESGEDAGAADAEVTLGKLIQEAYEDFGEKRHEAALKKLEGAETLVIEKNLGDDSLVSVKNFKGFNRLGLRDLEAAKEEFENALELNPDSSQACSGMGEVYYLMNFDNRAKKMYEWAVKNNPENKFAVEGLRKVNREMNLPEDHNSLDTARRE